MEKATRERLTGAVILVALLAITVPELLSGPGDDGKPADVVADAGPPLTTYDLALDSGAGDASSRQRELAATTATESQAIAQAVPPPVTERPPPNIVPEAEPSPAPLPPAAEPAPVNPPAPTAQSRAAAEARSAPAPAARTERPAAAAPTPSVQAPPAASSGRWWVQLGSFSSEENAQRLARDLRGKGFSIDVSKVKAGGRELHRVRAGPESDRAKATSLRDRLSAAGQKGTLVAP